MRANYNTRQKEIILEYLKSLKDKHVTVNEIKEYISLKGEKVGLTTIYRHLDKLIESGLVDKINMDNTAVFEYIEAGHDTCHLKCEVCNKLIHFQCDELSHVSNHMFKDHGFRINSNKTIFHGICDKCTDLK